MITRWPLPAVTIETEARPWFWAISVFNVVQPGLFILVTHV